MTAPHTAKIYQFTARKGSAEPKERRAQPASVTPLPLPPVIISSSWYHEEAIRETTQTKPH